MGERIEVEIMRLGAQGDGVATGALGPVFVPFALPGEKVAVEIEGGRARFIEVLRPSAARTAPPCRHFMVCGGCSAQHMSGEVYAEWKQSVVREAFAHRGLDVVIAPLVRVISHSRRRAYFGVDRQGEAVEIGFREESQHALVDLAECPVLAPEIVAAIPALKDVARAALPRKHGGRLQVTKLDHGLDVSFDTGLTDMTAQVRARVAALAEAAGLLRLTVAGDTIVTRGRPVLTLAGVEVEVPPGVFLQAVPEAEAHLTQQVMGALKKPKRVADLFSGLGTFTFALARVASVFAVDSDRRAIESLQAAQKRAQGLKPIETRVRDLFREPLSPKELETFDAVVFDPPRAGADQQSERIARSKVKTVVAVSCNPATLARDVRTLVDGGFKLETVTPLDQFLFSAHIEVVAVLRR